VECIVFQLLDGWGGGDDLQLINKDLLILGNFVNFVQAEQVHYFQTASFQLRNSSAAMYGDSSCPKFSKLQYLSF
jgi:hypothetical protein